MPTLAQIIARKFQKPKLVEAEIYNPLGVVISGAHPSIIMLNTVDLSDLRFSCKGIRECKRREGEPFADYDLVARNLDSQIIERRLRLVPDDNPDGDLTHKAVLLVLQDEFDYNEVFYDTLTTPPEYGYELQDGQEGFINAESLDLARAAIVEQFPDNPIVELTKSDIPDLRCNDDESEWWRVNDIRTAWEAQTLYVSDVNHDGKIQANEAQVGPLTYWDFYREAEIDGNTAIEFLFVEMDENHFFQIWRGVMIDPQRVSKEN